jgi:Domain of unknown function (DUF6457)
MARSFPSSRACNVRAVHEWLARARDALAEASGVDASQLELDGGSQAILLDLARIAAHEGGERTNAPLVCYLVGLAEGRSGIPLEELARAVP